MTKPDPTYYKIKEILLAKRKKIDADLQSIIAFTTDDPNEEAVASFRCKLSNIALINQLLIEIAEAASCSN